MSVLVWVAGWALLVLRGWVEGGREPRRQLLTFFTFLFHSSFATCTLTVLRASPAETTIPLSSLEMPPEAVLVTLFAAAATAGATALTDIAGCGPPVVIFLRRGSSKGVTWLFCATPSIGKDCSCEAAEVLVRRLACRDVARRRLCPKFNGIAPARHRCGP